MTTKSSASTNRNGLQETRSDLILNAFWVNVSPAQFKARILDISPDEVDSLRRKYGGEWHFKRHRGRRRGDGVVAVRVSGDSELEEDSALETLKVSENLGLVSDLVHARLPDRFSDDDVASTFPRLELRHRGNIANQVASSMGLQSIMGLLDVRPQFGISTRLINPGNKEPFIAIVVGIRTPNSITAQLSDLQKAGINLAGMAACRRNPEEDERRLAGTIARVESGFVYLDRRPEGTPEALPEGELQLEGRPEVIERCLTAIIGSRSSRRFLNQLEERLNSFRQGPELVKYLERVRERLSQPKPTLDISKSLLAEVKGFVEFRNTSDWKSHHRAEPLEYFYNPARTRSSHNAFKGIKKYGPYSQSSFPKQSPTLLVVTPEGKQGAAETFATQFKQGIQSSPYDAGFDATFRLQNTEFRFLQVSSGPTYNSSPGRAYKHTLEEYFNERSLPPNQEFDAAIIVLEDRFADYQKQDSPYLQAKSFLLTNGVPTQQVLISTMGDRRSLPYSMQNMSTALYAKMGGVPWTVSQDESVVDELVVGLGTAELHEGRFGARERFVGITTVFEGNGNYLLSNLSKTCSFDEYPEELRRITLQLLRKEKKDRAWKPGNLIRLTFHTTRPVRRMHVDRIIKECVEEVGSEQEVQFAFLTVGQRHPYVLLDKSNRRDQKAPFVPDRGTIARLSYPQILISPLGNHSIRSGEAMRRPLKLKLHGNSTFRDLGYLAKQVYKFTGISWKTVRPVKMPVTIGYSQLIARQLERLSRLPDFSPAMLNTALSASKWFL